MLNYKNFLAKIVISGMMCSLFLVSLGEKRSQAVEIDEISLSVGAKGDAVVTLQKLLLNAGVYYGEIDGVFGNMTKKAIESVQKNLGGDVDGIATQQLMLYLRNSTPDVSRGSRSLNMHATAYSAYDPGCGSYTASGNLVRKGLVAVDPSVIPLGTKLFIPGYGYAMADDIGGAINGHIIDLAFDSHEEALAFGSRRVEVYVIE